MCKEASAHKILITHGTDTMMQTAAFIAECQLDKMIILTGSFLPETFKDSDADFNIGVAIGALQSMPTGGVYIAMNGCVSHWSKCERDPQTNLFMGGM